MYDFDKYMYTDITKTDFIEIEKIEPDPDIRRLKYPHVTHQKKTIMTYVIDNKKIIKILKTNKLIGKKNIIHRRLNLKYFGNSLESDVGNTTLDKNQMFMHKNINKYDNIINNTNNNPKNFFGFTKFKHNEKEIKNEQKINPIKINKYNPNIIKNNLDMNSNNFSIIIKNFPNDISCNNLEQQLKNIFKVFGPIYKIKILYDKYTKKIKDIAFIDFYNTEDADKVLNSTQKFIIESSVLFIEKSKKN